MAHQTIPQELTERQQAVLDYILNVQQRLGRTPTGPEISAHLGFRDHSSAYQYLKVLEKKGYLELVSMGRGRQSGIRLGPALRARDERSWALFGSIPAGPLNDVVVDGSNRVSNLPDIIPEIRPGDYLLLVNGDSMIDEGLQPGNYVVIRPRVEPEQGDICAVWVDGEGGTLKRVNFDGTTVRLSPANKKYQPMQYPADQVRIQGVLVASFAVQSFRKAYKAVGT